MLEKLIRIQQKNMDYISNNYCFLAKIIAQKLTTKQSIIISLKKKTT